ncbi:MAG: hypothetical protein K0Q51_556 [Rickettsiaceae bacterium]|jgi:hypothetical protein|nr:hypothetical protein [Rickettsiaceae bacterium]
MDNDYDKMINELRAYEQEHAELNQLLDDEEQLSAFDQLTLQRFKKRKLWLKDKIIHLKSRLYPDIIA